MKKFLLLFYVQILFFGNYSSQDLLLGDYIPGNGLTFASNDDNYKVFVEVAFKKKELFKSLDKINID